MGKCKNDCHSGSKLLHSLRDRADHIKHELLKKCLPEVHITQDLFDSGTLILSKPAYYILKEDIVFNPNPADNYLPRPDQPQYLKPAFMIFGFFTAISITAKGFVFDFNGHSIGRSKEFALRQPVYSHIELADSPFVLGEGPLTPDGFPANLKAAENGLIFSSCKKGLLTEFFPHHGIHGNAARKIVVEDLIIRDFEVAAVAVNGGEEIFYRPSLELGPNTRQKFTTGAWHSLLMAIRSAERVPAADRDVDFTLALEAAILFRDSQFPILLGPNPETADPLIGNPSGIMDGNSYAVVNAPLGVAVDDFTRPGSERASSCRVLVDRVPITGIHAHITEVIALGIVNDLGEVIGVQTGPSGDVFRIFEVLTKGVPIGDATYVGNPISNLLIELAATQQRTGRPIGSTSIQPEVVRWAKFGAPFAGLQALYPFVCNGDSQAHVDKGINVVRFDKTQDAVINQVSITDVSNFGFLGNSVQCGHYAFSHPAQTEIGYHGADTTGFAISYCKQIQVLHPKVENLRSANGSARGVRIFNQSWRIKVVKGDFDQIRAGEQFVDGVWLGTEFDQRTWMTVPNVPYTAALPNGVPTAFGIDIWQDSEGRKIDGRHDAQCHKAHKHTHHGKKSCCGDFDSKGKGCKDKVTVILKGNHVGEVIGPIVVPYKTTNTTAQLP